jgi:hypothetical protein
MSIYGVTEDNETESAPAARNKIIADRKLKKRQLSSNTLTLKKPQPKPDVKDLATNVVDLLDSDIDEFSKDLTNLTKDYIDILRKEVIPHMAALDAAIDYVQALMSDGLGREDISSDTSIQTAQKWVLLGHFIERLSMKYGIARNEHISEKLATLMFNELSKTNQLGGPSSQNNGIVGIVKSLQNKLSQEQQRNANTQNQQRRPNTIRG